MGCFGWLGAIAFMFLCTQGHCPLWFAENGVPPNHPTLLGHPPLETTCLVTFLPAKANPLVSTRRTVVGKYEKNMLKKLKHDKKSYCPYLENLKPISK